MGLLLTIFLFQAFERYTISAYCQAVANACVATAQGVEGLRINPALLARTKRSLIGTGYEYTFSHIEGLQNIFIGFAGLAFHGGLGIGMSQFGFSEEKEQALTAAYGIGLSNEFYAGGAFDLYLIQNKRTGSCLSYGLSVGMLGLLHKKWYLGACGRNLNQPQFGNGTEGILPPSLQVGIGYRPFEDIISEIDLYMDEYRLSIRVAGVFSIVDFISLRTGFKTNPNSLSGGFGISYKYIKLDYGCEFIMDLPLNHTLSLNFEF